MLAAIPNPGRDNPVPVGGFIQEWWAASSRYGGRHNLGIVGGFVRNQQRDMRTTASIMIVGASALFAPSLMAAEVRTGPAAFGDWRSDALGVMRKITAADVALAVTMCGGPAVDKKAVELRGAVKTVGSHKASIKLHPGVTASVTFEVVAV